VYFSLDTNAISYASLCRPNHEVHTPASTDAGHSGTVTGPQKRMHFPKSFMVEAIKVHLIKLLGAHS
jgi:hypothetical protein